MNLPKANMQLVKQAKEFLLETGLYHSFCMFCTGKMIGKEMLHSDRWGMIYDWLQEQKINKPDGIETALTEWFEVTCIHVKKI